MNVCHKSFVSRNFSVISVMKRLFFYYCKNVFSNLNHVILLYQEMTAKQNKIRVWNFWKQCPGYSRFLGTTKLNCTFVFAEGVPVLTVVVLPKPNFGFFSVGFSIWKEHISVSSTLIMAPALSNSPQ